MKKARTWPAPGNQALYKGQLVTLLRKRCAGTKWFVRIHASGIECEVAKAEIAFPPGPQSSVAAHVPDEHAEEPNTESERK